MDYQKEYEELVEISKTRKPKRADWDRLFNLIHLSVEETARSAEITHREIQATSEYFANNQKIAANRHE